MDPKLERLNINWSADEAAEYIDRFNFWVDTRGTIDEKAIKGAFLTAFGKDEFSMLRTLVYPKTLRDDNSCRWTIESLLRAIKQLSFYETFYGCIIRQEAML